MRSRGAVASQVELLRHVDAVSQIVLRNAGVVFFSTDSDGTVTYVSPSVERVTGDRPEDVTGRHFTDLIHPDDLPRIRKQFELLARGIGGPDEYRVLNRSGEARWVVSSSTPLFDGNRAFTGVVGVLTDIQRRKSAEDAFRESEAQFSETFDLAGVGIAHASPDGRWVRVNRTFCEIVGYGRDELLERTVPDVMHAEDRSGGLESMQQMLRGGIQTATRETRVVRKDGFTVWVNLTLSAVRDRQGAVRYFIAVIEDLSGRIRMENALRLFSTAAASLPLGITITDLDGKVIFVNAAEARMHGYGVDELLGREAKQLAPLGARTGLTLRELIARNLIGDIPYAREVTNVRRDGTVFPVSLSSVPVRDMRGTPLGLVSVSEDITERRNMIEALKESEEKYRNLFESANDAIFIADYGSGILTDCNVKACELLGRERSEIIGMHQSQLHLGKWAALERTPPWPPEEGPPPETLNEDLVLRKDGRRVWVDVSSNLFESGGRKFVMSIYRDVTSRKVAEEQFVKWTDQLRESEMRFRELADLLPQPVFEANALGVMTFANRSAYEHFGYTSSDLAEGRHALHMVAPADRARALADMQRVLKGEQPRGNEYRAVRKDGSEFPAIIAASAVLRDGRPAGLRGVVMDITDRKRTEDAIAQAKQDWESTFDTITDMITIHDENFTIIRSNRAAAQILGLSWLGMGRAKCYEYYHGTDRPPDHCPSCESLRTGRPSLFERYEPHLGKYLEIRAIPRLDVQGRLVGLIHVVRDITERKQAEEERAALEARLRDAQKMEVIGSLAGGVAHEVRNPLNAIMALTDALDREIGGDPEYQTFMGHMRTQVERLTTLMNDLLELGKPVDQSQLRSERLAEIIALSVDAWKQSKWGRGRAVEVAAQGAAGGALLRGDAKKLQQVFINLLDNAAQHSPPGSLIRIETLPVRDGTVEVRIVDRGAGAPDKVLPLVFDTFFTTRRGGTGLGLNIVKHIIETHGGTVALSANTPPPGCTATVVLPARENGAQ